MKLQRGKSRIVGLGSALVDILINESDEFARRIGVQKGGMTLVDMPDLEKILNQASTKPIVVPGGSACNTAVGIRRLGGQAALSANEAKTIRDIFLKMPWLSGG